MELASGGRRGTPRAPVMIRGEARGASSRFGRGLRIEVVADGSVVVSDDAGEIRRIPAGSVTRAVVTTTLPRWAKRGTIPVPQERLALLTGPVEIVALFAGPVPVLVVCLLDFSSLVPGLDELPESVVGQRREASGVNAVVAALGVTLSVANPAEVAALASRVGVAAAVVPFSEKVWGPRWGTWVALVALWVLVCAWLLLGGVAGELLMAAAFVALLPLVVRMQVLIGAYCAAVPALSDDPEHTLKASGGSIRGLRESVLVIRPDVVRIHVRAAEFSVPGPALGAVTDCWVDGSVIRFTDGVLNPYLNVSADVFCPDGAGHTELAELCAAAGIRMTHRAPRHHVSTTSRTVDMAASGEVGGLALTPAEQGNACGAMARYTLLFNLLFLTVFYLGGVAASSPIATQSGGWSGDVVRWVLPLLVYGGCLGVMLRTTGIRLHLNHKLKAKV